MGKRIVIDPITRIEGHLRIDVDVTDGAVSNAWASGQMWRGIETMLRGRDPREAWAFTQRICGVCTTVHAMASVRAVENAYRIDVPRNAQYVRNMMIAAHALHDHVVHFYHLSALDWVDIVSALSADPVKAARLAATFSEWPGNTAEGLAAVKDRVAAFAGGGQLGPFANGYWGHPAMRLPAEVNLIGVAHYLAALDIQRKANQIVAILGGKTPNVQNLVVGGVTNIVGGDDTLGLGPQRLALVEALFAEVAAFVQKVYLPDVAAIGALYADWLGYGAGVTNYLAVPDMPLDEKGTEFDMPGGVITGADLATLRPIRAFGDEMLRAGVTEQIAHSWYEGAPERHPYEGETNPKPGEFEDEGRYSWVKAPRFEGQPMQVGPLAQVLVAVASGDARTKRWLDHALGIAASVAGGPVPLAGLHSTLGRHLARAVRAAVLSELGPRHLQLLRENVERGDRETFTPWSAPAGEVRGFGFHEAPRGVLSHWLVARDGITANYQCVVPSTWNASPRDGKGQPGPYEASLLGNPMADPERPLEALRTVHSFDPCLACAIHTHDASGEVVARVRVL